MRDPWRFASPSTVLFALILFPLPWIEIQCPGFLDSEKTTILKKRPEEKTQAPAKAQSSGPNLSGWLGKFLPGAGEQKAILVQQSGLQAAIGSWSFGSEVNRESLQTARLSAEMDAGTAPSWRMIAYGLVLVVGIVAGYWSRNSKRRCAIVGLCALTALGLGVTERLSGFPLEDAFRQIRWANVLADTSKVPPSMDGVLKEDLRYTVWYFLAQAMLITGAGLAALEWWLQKRCRELPTPANVAVARCLDPPVSSESVAVSS
jgi:hypothetical protein